MNCAVCESVLTAKDRWQGGDIPYIIENGPSKTHFTNVKKKPPGS